LASFINTEIDNSRPLILQVPQHVVVIVGYDYSDISHRKLICHDSASSNGYEELEDELSIIVTNDQTRPNKITKNEIVYFNRVR
jgi:hypothetical protein